MPDPSGPHTLLELIEEAARVRRSSPAILAPDRPPLAYEALLRQVEHTGASLAALGLGRGQRIGLALPNGPEMAVAILSTMGWATCAPLNPASDEASCRALLEQMRVDALVVAEGAEPPAARAARALGVIIVRLAFEPDQPAGVFSLFSNAARKPIARRRPRLDDVALLLTTSGTTARPKIVPVTHRIQVRGFAARVPLMGLTTADRCLCIVPLFTASAIKRSLGPALSAGASIVCTPGFDAEHFFAWVAAFHPTYYTGPPTVQQAILEAYERRAKPPHSLRVVFSGSAPLSVSLQDRLENALGVPVLQGYAMSEAGCIAHDPLPPAGRKPGSVGLPAGGEVRVLGKDYEFLSAGEVGEIVVRGGETFAGYEDDPEANRLAFHDGWFRTGDLGYLDQDDFVYITGRVKEVINRGALKVSPGAVDAALLQHPQVQEVATFGIPHPTLTEDVLAAVVPRDPQAVGEQELRDFALQRLAAFMVPSRIVFVSELPKTPLGKVRRRELAERFGGARRCEFLAPRDAHEEVVARLYSELLGCERVGALDNFFDLGGDSLRGAQLVLRANLALGCSLPAESLFRRPTVAGFAAELRAGAQTAASSVPPPIKPRQKPRGGHSAASDGQTS